MHIEEGTHLFGHIAREVALECGQFGAHGGAGTAQALDLGVKLVFVDQVVRHIERRTRQHVGAADGDAARDRNTVKGKRHRRWPERR